ncbi:MAG: cell division protein ZapA [Deltaproteobacteria bacterium]|nr:cell division protein ZapA [Deltaproteobacteria bacterium]
MKRAVEITLLNQKFTVKTDADDGQVQRLTDYVEKKLSEMQGGSKTTPLLGVALLTCLNIAEEYFKLKESRSGTVVKAEKKIKDLIQLIEERA